MRKSFDSIGGVLYIILVNCVKNRLIWIQKVDIINYPKKENQLNHLKKTNIRWKNCTHQIHFEILQKMRRRSLRLLKLLFNFNLSGTNGTWTLFLSLSLSLKIFSPHGKTRFKDKIHYNNNNESVKTGAQVLKICG